MNKYVKGALIFLSGAIAGSVPTYIVCSKLANKKIGTEVTNQVKIAREENEMLRKELIKKNNSMKDELTRLNRLVKEKDGIIHASQTSDEEYTGEVDEELKEELQEKVKEEKYTRDRSTNYSSKYNKKNDSNISVSANVSKEPYVIPPEEFGKGDGANYNIVALTYYSKSDAIARVDTHELIYEYGEFIVSDIADHFGEYIGNEVYVRNDVLQTDYDIILNDEDEVYEP